jgi:general secretion pathway protein I
MGSAIKKFRERGFTLIEVLVAFAILALFLGAVMPTLSSSISASRTGGDTITATAYAQSLIAGVGVNAKINEGTFSNTLEEPRFRSLLEIRPFPGFPTTEGDARLYEVVAHVSWRDGARARKISLTSFRFSTGQ